VKSGDFISMRLLMSGSKRHKSPPPFTVERRALLAGKTCGSEVVMMTSASYGPNDFCYCKCEKTVSQCDCKFAMLFRPPPSA